MSNYHRKALFAAVLAGLGAVGLGGGRCVAGKRDEPVFPSYKSFGGSYEPVPRAKNHGTRKNKNATAKRKGVHPGKKKHRMKKKGKR